MATETEIVLAEMFTENTGRALCDSGDAYGRNWERNSGKIVEDFLAAPKVTMRVSTYGPEVTIDSFHFLNDRLEYAPDMQRKFDLFANVIMPDEHLFTVMEEFADAHAKKYGRNGDNFTENTYNHESLLSQVLQYTVFTGPGDEQFILLQVHGGADVRGGYTAPKAFRFTGYEGLYEMYSDSDYVLYCDHKEPEFEPLPGMPEVYPVTHAVSVRNGDVDSWDGGGDPWRERNIEMVYTDEETNESFVRCPWCSDEPRPMSVSID